LSGLPCRAVPHGDDGPPRGWPAECPCPRKNSSACWANGIGRRTPPFAPRRSYGHWTRAIRALRSSPERHPDCAAWPINCLQGSRAHRHNPPGTGSNDGDRRETGCFWPDAVLDPSVRV
jgi:hypothetical protein